MNKKGFTLIEIIAVIVIMGILLLIVVPTTSNLMRSNEEKEYQTYYDIVKEGLEKYGRTRMNEIGGSTSFGCIDDKDVEDLIRKGYFKAFDQEDDVVCGTPAEFQELLSGWGIDTSKEYANMRVEGDHGKVTTKLSLICVKQNSDGTYESTPEYVKLVEAGECKSSSGGETQPPSNPSPSDTTPPTCVVTKLSTGWNENSVTINLGCNDASGCETTNLGNHNLSVTTTYTIYDTAGNHTDCVVGVSKKRQQQDKNVCTNITGTFQCKDQGDVPINGPGTNGNCSIIPATNNEKARAYCGNFSNASSPHTQANCGCSNWIWGNWYDKSSCSPSSTVNCRWLFKLQ